VEPSDTRDTGFVLPGLSFNSNSKQLGGGMRSAERLSSFNVVYATRLRLSLHRSAIEIGRWSPAASN